MNTSLETTNMPASPETVEMKEFIAPEYEQAAAPQILVDPRRRLRELMSVPERDRNEAQWDEIVELEIQLAPGNRVGINAAANGAGMRPQGQGAGIGGGQKKPFFKGPGARMKRNRPPKPV